MYTPAAYFAILLIEGFICGNVSFDNVSQKNKQPEREFSF